MAETSDPTQEHARLRDTLDAIRALRVEDYAALDEAYDRAHRAEDALRLAERALAAVRDFADTLAFHVGRKVPADEVTAKLYALTGDTQPETKGS